MKRTLLAALLVTVSTPLAAQDWSGAYGGLQFGGSDISASGGLSGDGESLGIFGGYNIQSKGLVYGVELDWDDTDYAIGGGAVNVENTARLKGRVGLQMGNGIGYATAGIVRASTDAIGSDTGYLVGLGYDYALSENTIIGGEVLQHEFDNFDGSGIDVSVTTFKARVAFRF